MAGNKKPSKKYNPQKRVEQLKRLKTHVEKAMFAKTLREFGALTIDERLKLKLPPHEAFLAMRNGQGNQGGWGAIMVRLYVGLEVAERLQYEDSVQDDFRLAIACGEKIYSRALASQVQPAWTVTSEEAEQIHLCLNATDELQDVTETEKRLDVLWEAFKKTDEHLAGFI